MTAKTYPNASMAPDGSSYVTLTDGAGNLVGSAASGLTIGTTPISGGATTQVLFNLAGKVSSDSGFTYVGSSGAVTILGTTNIASAFSLLSNGFFFRDGTTNPLGLGSGNKIIWSSTTDGAGGSNDLGLARNGAGILEVNNSTPGTFAALKVSGLTNSTTRNDTGYGYFQPTTGQTITLSNTAYNSIIDPAGTLANLTVNLPSTPTDGMMVTFRFSQIITALVVSGNGHSILGNPTTAALGATLTAIYKVSNTTWYM